MEVRPDIIIFVYLSPSDGFELHDTF